MALISAHRCGAPKDAGDQTILTALADVLAIPCEYVEVDVLRTADGQFVVRHDVHVTTDGHRRLVADLTLAELRGAVGDVVTFEECLRRLAGHKHVHLDLKFASPPETYAGPPELTHEVHAAEIAVDLVGADQVIVTSLEDLGIKAVRSWCRAPHPELLVGLSLGRSLAGLPPHRQVLGRLSELFPGRRVVACDASLVVANHWLARLAVARWTARRGVPLLVWTVDGRRGLTRWLADPRVWMVTTNHAALATQLRRTRVR